MPTRERILGKAEKRSSTIYGSFQTAFTLDEMQILLADEKLSLSLKFTAILASYARLAFPLRIAEFRSLIPDVFWAKYCRFSYITYGRGPTSVYVEHEQGEMNYNLNIGPDQSPYGVHGVEFVSDKLLLPEGVGLASGIFDPSLDASVSRFGLHHPFLKPELHDGSEIYLLQNA